MLRTSPSASAIAYFPNHIEVEIRQEVPAVIVRGIRASNYDTVISAAPELANRGLDIFAMSGRDNLALDDVWSTHVAWWSTHEAAIARVWCSATLPIAVSVAGEVRNSDGTVKQSDVEATPAWQESMRYFRMSEITDDLFDAFRNIYLALESLLDIVAPIKRKQNGRWESEDEWFKRALTEAAKNLDLRRYLRHSTGNPQHDIYDELHNRVRARVFHAKATRQPFLPQDLSDRAQVSDAKDRYARLYLDLTQESLGIRTRHGGTNLSSTAARAVNSAMTRNWKIAFTGDSTKSTSPATNSPLWENALPPFWHIHPQILAATTSQQLLRGQPPLGRPRP